MNRADLPAPPVTTNRSLFGLRPVVAGTACCVVSSLGYTGSSICMRKLSVLDCDPMWVIFNKELVTVAVVGPWLLWRAFRGFPVIPPGRALAMLALVGLFVQLGANLGMQWAMGVVGLAVVVPCIFGVMLTSSAAMGQLMLGERVSRRSAMAIGLLLGSLVLLGLAAREAGQQESGGFGMSTVLLGVAVACIAGAIYAMLTITIRHTATGTTPISAIVFTTTLMGVVTLGPMSVYRLGSQQLLDTPPEHFAWMMLAGTLNFIAFVAISKGLELTTVVHANVLNASQVAMAAVAGMALFHEPKTGWLLAGVAVTVVGIVLIGRPVEDDLTAAQHT